MGKHITVQHITKHPQNGEIAAYADERSGPNEVPLSLFTAQM